MLIVLVGCILHVWLCGLVFVSLAVSCCFVGTCVLVGGSGFVWCSCLLLVAVFWWFDVLACLIWYGLWFALVFDLIVGLNLVCLVCV